MEFCRKTSQSENRLKANIFKANVMPKYKMKRIGRRWAEKQPIACLKEMGAKRAASVFGGKLRKFHPCR